MKLHDLIEALAKEIEMLQPEMAAQLDQLAVRDASDDAFMDALEQYSSQVQRMGEAAEMAGFAGLQAVCSHVVENTLLLGVAAPGERAANINFLRRWPELVTHHLRNLSDPSTAAGLVDHLRTAPFPLDEEQALRVMHKLGAMQMQVDVPDHEQENLRPILARPEDVDLTIPKDADEKLLEGFFQEAPDQVRRLVDLVRNMAAGVQDAESIVTAKRIAHTLKGTGATIGLRGIAALGHHFEDILEHFAEQGSHVSQPVADTLLDAAYCLEQMVGHLNGNDDFPQQAQAVLQEVLDMANRIDRGESVDEPVQRVGLPAGTVSSTALAAAPEAPAPARAAPGAAASNALRVGMDRIDELFRISGEVLVHTAAMETRIKDLNDRAKALLEQNLRMQKRLFELETVVDVRALTMMRARSQRGEGSNFDPLEMDQYSELHSTAHALVEEAADARELAHRMEEGIAQLTGMQNRQQLLSRDLQHLVISTRMAEVSLLESRLQRNVRNTSQMTGKQAVLHLSGGETLIDSDLLNRLAEPLLHLIRNAVDHGIETPEERVRQGKPEAGRLALDFSRQGQQVVLRFSDDGRGLDLHAIQRRAIERGLIAENQPLSDDDLARLILMPGFSTRDSVSEVSGRGIGLDVVRDWVASVNGAIRIFNRPRAGCTFELRFAASLSTMQSLVVEVGQQRFALPSVHIEQAVPRDTATFDMLANKILFQFNKRVIPAQFLHSLVGLPIDPEKPLKDYDAVIVRLQNKEHVLLVDDLVDSRELLVKAPGRFARHVRGVAGLSILGDGSIAVNLDMAQLLDPSARRIGSVAPAKAKLPQQKKDQPSILIVDDALSVRNTLQQLMQDAGWQAETARDGMEAIGLLNKFKPTAVLTDLEMPNMNGVELTSHIRARDDDLKRLPVIMITSRSHEKHRQLAEQAGVDAYITKPYNDGDLLQAIRNAVAA